MTASPLPGLPGRTAAGGPPPHLNRTPAATEPAWRLSSDRRRSALGVDWRGRANKWHETAKRAVACAGMGMQSQDGRAGPHQQLCSRLDQSSTARPGTQCPARPRVRFVRPYGKRYAETTRRAVACADASVCSPGWVRCPRSVLAVTPDRRNDPSGRLNLLRFPEFSVGAPRRPRAISPACRGETRRKGHATARRDGASPQSRLTPRWGTIMKAARKSIPRSNPNIDTAHSRYFRDLEHKLIELCNLAHIAATWIEDAFAEDLREPFGEPFAHHYRFSEADVSATLILVYEMQAKVKRIRREYTTPRSRPAPSRNSERCLPLYQSHDIWPHASSPSRCFFAFIKSRTLTPVQERSPMTFSIYQASVPVYIRRLKALSTILDKAAAYASQRKSEPAVLTQAALPGHAALARHVPSDTQPRRSGKVIITPRSRACTRAT